MAFFDDPNFVDNLLTLVVWDRVFLRDHSDILSVGDFEPGITGAPLERWYTAGICLNFWQKYKHPVGRFLPSEIKKYIRDAALHDKAANSLIAYSEKLIKMRRFQIPAAAVSDHLREYKSEKSKFDAINELMEHMKSGSLNNDLWLQITRKAVDTTGTEEIQITDYFHNLESRIARRKAAARFHDYPYLMIDGFDDQARAISFGHIGLVMAPYKRGKSLFLSHLAVASALQGFNVLHFTLEDKVVDLEDRLDAAISRLPVKELAVLENKLRIKFKNFQRLIDTKINIVDGTNGNISIQAIESTYQREREKGFQADVIIVDYDHEIKPAQKRSKRYEEFDEIYTDFRSFVSRSQTIGWIASQTGRGTEEMQYVTGADVEGSMFKLRKCTLAVSIGRGQWGEDSIFFWVDAHKLDKQGFGFNIFQSKDMMRFYDRRRTLEKQAEEDRNNVLKKEAESEK